MKKRFDHIRGSWLVLVALGCVALITALGLGSERVRRVVRAHLPAILGGSVVADQPEEAPPPEKPPPPPPDPDALPVMPADTSLRGVVKDRAGKPIAGATVSAERWREGKWESLGTAKTNKAGGYVLGPLPKASLSAVARAAGYASERKSAPTGSTVDFTLKAGGTLAGKVVDAVTGDPIAECILRGWSESGNWYEQALSGKDGVFRFPSVPPGRVWLQVSPPAHKEVNLNDLDVREGAETFKEIPVVKGGLLKGKVLDAETGAPIPDARLRTWGGERNVTSKEDGSYEIPSPPPGGLSLRAGAKDYPTQWVWLQLSGDPDGTFDRDIRLGRGGKVSGVVRKPDGSPAEGARVGMDPSNLVTGVPEDTATTDAEGRFALEGVPGWRGARLFALADGFALTKSDPFDLRPGAETSGVNIALRSGTAMRGTVLDEERQPLAGVCFNLNRQWIWNEGGENSWYWIPALTAYSKADGTFEIPAISQGTYSLNVYLEGFAPETRQNLQMAAEGSMEGQEFTLRRGTSITGRVAGAEGKALEGANVNAWGWNRGSDGSWSWTQRTDVRTDPEGKFVLDGLREGGYTLNVNLSGFMAFSQSGVAAGTRELQVVLQPNPRVEGVVVEIDGKPCPTFRLRVLLEAAADGTPARGQNVILDQEFADREGKFSLRDLQPGQVSIEAISGTKIAPRVHGVFLRAGTVVEGLRLMLGEGGRLEVRVRDAAGAPLNGANVSAGRMLPDGVIQGEHGAQAGEDGKVVFTALTDGTWVVQAQFQGKVRGSKTVQVVGGAETVVDLVLRIGGNILVKVVDKDGKPVEGVYVRFLDREGGGDLEFDWSRLWERANRDQQAGRRVDWGALWRSAQYTAADGHLRREGLTPGPAFVTLFHKDYDPASAPVTVIDGFEVDLPFTIRKKGEPKEGEGGPKKPVEGDGAEDR